MDHDQPSRFGSNLFELAERSTLTMSEDGQQLTIETPQSVGAAALSILASLVCVVFGIRELFEPAPLVVSEFFPPRDDQTATTAFIFALALLGFGAYLIYSQPRIVTVIDRATQTGRVTSSHFDRQFVSPVTIALDSISATRLVGTANRWKSTAKIVAEVDGIETDLTGALNTSFADEVQKAIRGLLRLD